MDKKQKSQFLKLFLVSLFFLTLSFCFYKIADPAFLSRLPNVSAEEASYLVRRALFSAMLQFTGGAYIMGFALLKLKKPEKDEEQEADKKQGTGEK